MTKNKKRNVQMKIIEENFEGIYGSFLGELHKKATFRVDLLNDLILEICVLIKKRADQDLSDADLLPYIQQLFDIYSRARMIFWNHYNKNVFFSIKNFVFHDTDCYFERLRFVTNWLLCNYDYSALEDYEDDLGYLIPEEIKAQKNFDRIKKTHKRKIGDIVEGNLSFLPGTFMGELQEANVFDIASFKEVLFYGYSLIKGYQSKVISKTAYSKKRDQFYALYQAVHHELLRRFCTKDNLEFTNLPKTYAVYHERLNYMFECLVKEEKYTQIEAYKDALGYLIPKAIKYPSRTSTNKKKR